MYTCGRRLLTLIHEVASEKKGKERKESGGKSNSRHQHKTTKHTRAPKKKKKKIIWHKEHASEELIAFPRRRRNAIRRFSFIFLASRAFLHLHWHPAISHQKLMQRDGGIALRTHFCVHVRSLSILTPSSGKNKMFSVFRSLL